MTSASFLRHWRPAGNAGDMNECKLRSPCHQPTGGLRNYHLKVLQSLEAGAPTYHAVQSLWDDAGNLSEPESEDEEMEVA